MKKISTDENKEEKISSIYIMKAIAVFSIVAAHVKLVDDNASKINIVFSNILYPIGTIGVTVFFMLSGYLFWNNKHGIRKFISIKIKSLIIPWLFTGTLVYLYVYLRKGGITVNSYFNFMIGNNSYLYYLTILIQLYFIFYFIKKDIFLYIGIIISVISNLLTVYEVLDVNPYMNVLNWSIYFIVGIVIAKKELFIKIVCFCAKKFYFIGTVFILLIVVSTYNNYKVSYWGYFDYVMIFFGILLTFGLSKNYNFKATYIRNMGKRSFSIYLLHMPVAGIIVNIFNRYNLYLLTLLRPIIVIFIVLVVIDIVEIIAKYFNIHSIFNQLIGYRG